MKQTQTINLGGIVFHIEIDAYDQLQEYLTSIKNQFSVEDGQEEIIEDIEARIAEILSEKKVKIITGKYVDKIIAIMGRPEQYSEEDADKRSEDPPPSPESVGTTKRIYRHPEDKIMGGVCGGLGALVGIDPVIFRVLFLITAFFGGFGVLLYLVMWLIVPLADSTADRLKMQGKPITTDSIGKAITAQVEKSINQETSQNALKKFFSFIGQVIEVSFDILRKIFQALGIILRPILGIAFLVFGFALTLWSAFLVFGYEGKFWFFNTSFSHYIDASFLALPGSYLWVYIALTFFLVIPIFEIIYLGLRLLFRISRQSGLIKGISAGVWILSLVFLIFFGVFSASRYSADGYVRRTAPLIDITADTVHVSIWENDYFVWTDRKNHILKSNKGDMLISDVELDVKRSEDNSFHLIIYRKASGSTSKDARAFAENISFHYLSSANSLSLKNYLKIKNDEPFALQEVKLTLLVPEGKSVYLDETLKYMLDDVANITNTYDRFMIDHTWKMTETGLACTDCN